MIKQVEFSTRDVVAVSCAIFRQQGYFKRGEWQYVAATESEEAKTQETKVANSSLLYNHFLNNDRVEIINEDVVLAETIIDYLKGLSFKAFERTLTEFEANVLKFVNADAVGKDKLGIAASLPNVYSRKLEADKWTEREKNLAERSDYVGNLNKRCSFNLKVEHVRSIPSTASYLYTCSEADKNIVKFFNSAKIAEAGDDIVITGYVKGQGVSKYSGGKETMVNRVKVSS